MSSIKHFINDSLKKSEIDEYLMREFERAGYGGVDITRTLLGTRIVVYVMRPGIILTLTPNVPGFNCTCTTPFLTYLRAGSPHLGM